MRFFHPVSNFDSLVVRRTTLCYSLLLQKVRLFFLKKTNWDNFSLSEKKITKQNKRKEGGEKRKPPKRTEKGFSQRERTIVNVQYFCFSLSQSHRQSTFLVSFVLGGFFSLRMVVGSFGFSFPRCCCCYHPSSFWFFNLFVVVLFAFILLCLFVCRLLKKKDKKKRTFPSLFPLNRGKPKKKLRKKRRRKQRETSLSLSRVHIS